MKCINCGKENFKRSLFCSERCRYEYERDRAFSNSETLRHLRIIKLRKGGFIEGESLTFDKTIDELEPMKTFK